MKGIKSEGKIQTSNKMFDDDDGRFKRRLDVVTSTEERQSLDLSQPNKRVGRGNKRNQMRKI